MNDDELKRRILLKTGLTNITSGDCVKIAARIKECLDKKVSVTTLKRVFGFAKVKHSFSKYTLATLVDYVNSEDVDLSLELASAKSVFSATFDCLISLHPKQLVLEALEVLLKYDQESLPIVDRGKQIGVVYTKELIYFLTCNEAKYGTLFHKLNFDLHTAIVILHRK